MKGPTKNNLLNSAKKKALEFNIKLLKRFCEHGFYLRCMENLYKDVCYIW